jgi:hypothetical protein
MQKCSEALRQRVASSCLYTRPHQIIVVTVDSDKDIISGIAMSVDPTVLVLSIPFPNKRHQVSKPFAKSQVASLSLQMTV